MVRRNSLFTSQGVIIQDEGSVGIDSDILFGPNGIDGTSIIDGTLSDAAYADGVLTAAKIGDPTNLKVLPTGTKALFYQGSAPTNWTKQTTDNDKALRVVSGTGGTAGGSTAFSSVFASRQTTGGVAISGTPGDTVAAGTVSVSMTGSIGQHTLTTAQLASHQHTADNILGWDNFANYNDRGVLQPGHRPGQGYYITFDGGNPPYSYHRSVIENIPRTGLRSLNRHGPGFSGVANAGSGQGHNHPTGNLAASGNISGQPSSVPAGNLAASFQPSAMDFACQYCDVIICARD